jgi:hypothetical protein
VLELVNVNLTESSEVEVWEEGGGTKEASEAGIMNKGGPVSGKGMYCIMILGDVVDPFCARVLLSS